MILSPSDLFSYFSAYPWAILSPAFALGATIVMLLLQRRVDPEPTSGAARAFQLAVTICAPVWLGIAFMTMTSELKNGPIDDYRVALGYLSTLVGVGWVLTNTFGAIRNFHRTSRGLATSLTEQETLNELLVTAESARFAQYRTTIHDHVSYPLRSILRNAKGTPTVRLAEIINTFQLDELRPMAHALHPVTVNMGLIPAMTSTNSEISVNASTGIRQADAQGTLLDDSVRRQVFRWFLKFSNINTIFSIEINSNSNQIIIEFFGADRVPGLDPMQQIAGLQLQSSPLENKALLVAPLLGENAAPIPLATVKEAKVPYELGSIWGNLTHPPHINLALILYISIASLPTMFNVFDSDITLKYVLLTALGVGTPLLIALPLTKVRVAVGTKKGAFQVIGMWLVIALSTALVFNLAILVFAPENFLLFQGSLRVVGALSRYAVIGPLFVLTHGYLARRSADDVRLKERLDDSALVRADLLLQSDETDRYLAEALHRTVQGRVSAIEVLLRTDRRDEAIFEISMLCDETLPAIEYQLEHAITNHLNSEIPIPRADTRLSLVEEIDWQALAELDGFLNESLRRVVEECLVNAQVHGQATFMKATVDHTETDIILTCVDNGQGPLSNSTPGLGSQLFDEICSHMQGSWSISRRHLQTVFEMRVPIHPTW